MKRVAVAPGTGFSLLELMVAMAILSLGMVLLLQAQARSIALAQEARALTVATQLLRAKLYDCQEDLLKKGFSIGDYDESGKFDEEGYGDFYWECHAYRPDMPVPDSGDISAAAVGGATGVAAGTDDASGATQGADLGMQFLAPILSQMASVMGDSIRELVVIVRWGEGAEQQDLQVTTHVIDKTPVNGVAAMLAPMCAPAGGAGGGAPSGAKSSPGSGAKGPPPAGPSSPPSNFPGAGVNIR